MQCKFDTKKRSYVKLLVIVLLIMIGNLSYLLSNSNFNNSPSNNSNFSAFNLPKTNAGEITIITPENVTYTEVISGYYPAVDGFENEVEGTLGTAVEYVDVTTISSGCEVQIYDEFQGHKKVLRLHDGNTAGNARAQHNFTTTHTTGTVEWWWISPISGTNGIAFNFHEGLLGAHAGNVLMQDGSFKDMDNIIVQSYVANQWYHHKVVFNTISDTYDWYIDGNLRVDDGNFENPVNNIGSTNIKGGWTSTGSCYVDAIGYSWDPSYNIGDNLNEGLLLSYDNTVPLDWVGYSLDGQANKTILGNSSITLPDPGLHKVQVFGNDSIGTMHQSNLRYLSVSHINVITPENKTYGEPMDGYYPALYGFEDEVNGISGTAIRFVDAGNYPTCQIIPEMDGHKKVLQLSQTFGWGQVTHNVSDVSSGTVEWWVRVPVGYVSHRLLLRENDAINADIYFHDDGMIYEHDGTQAPFTTYVGNTWTHMRLDFECGLGGYEGLTADTFYVYVDGVKFGPYNFMNGATEIDQLYFDSGDEDSTRYMDAIGYSWDKGYSVGDNRREGLLLSLENATSMDWLGYSLDNQANKTIYGNTTLLMPDLGSHKIQLFGNTSLGTIYETSTRYFSVSPINLLTPENIAYSMPMSGYYPATYGFENEKIGNEGDTIEYVDYAWITANTEIKIYDEFQGHEKVFRLHDGSASQNVHAQNHFDTPSPASGTVEWWWSTEISGTNNINYDFLEGIMGTRLLRLKMWNGNFMDWEGHIIQSYVPNQWYHHKIFFDTVSDTYDWYIDGIKKVEGNNFENPVDNIGSTETKGGVTYTGSCYMDAISYSWVNGYNSGDNLNEGLLLSYENSTNLDWQGYSLDGQANKTILGNTSIVLPTNGLHTIQLFANDTSGTMYRSDLRYFIVDVNGPTISAISPSTNQYYGIIAPSFSIDVQGVNLDEFWYSLDNGVTNISFTSFTGSISTSEWNKFAHGPVQIRFYANDSFNQIGFEIITVNKDLNTPTTSIQFVPYSGANVVLPATLFSLSATDNSESGISTIRYRIDASAWIPYAGAFTLSSYPSGYYTITYQSIDAVGNIETEKYLVIELYIPSPPPDTPNFIPFFLFGLGIGLAALIGIGILVFRRRRIPKTPIKARTDEKPHPGSDKLKVCPFCFAEIKIKSKFCTSCGASLEKD